MDIKWGIARTIKEMKLSQRMKFDFLRLNSLFGLPKH